MSKISALEASMCLMRQINNILLGCPPDGDALFKSLPSLLRQPTGKHQKLSRGCNVAGHFSASGNPSSRRSSTPCAEKRPGPLPKDSRAACRLMSGVKRYSPGAELFYLS